MTVVDYRVDGRVATITLRRPEARNAVNADVAHGVEDAIDRLEADPDVWVGIIAGDGPVFSAGADLKEIAAGRVADLETERGGFGGIARRDGDKPMIAAVDGPALAGGCEIVLACDLVVASRQAAFGLPEVKRSLVAAAGGLFRLPRKLPRNIALEIIMTGDPIDGAGADDATAWKLTGDALRSILGTEDFLEGPRAFVEKRPADWKGR